MILFFEIIKNFEIFNFIKSSSIWRREITLSDKAIKFEFKNGYNQSKS